MALYKSVYYYYYYYYYYYRYKAFRERKPCKGWPFPITASGSDNERILISSDVRVKTDGDRYTVKHSGGHVTYGYLPSRGWCVPGAAGGTLRHSGGHATYGYLPSRGWCVLGAVGGALRHCGGHATYGYLPSRS